MDNNPDKRMRSTRSNRQNIPNGLANCRPRSRSPTNSSNVPSTAGDGLGNELVDQMTPLEIAINEAENMMQTVVEMCRSLKKDIEDQKKRNETQQKDIEDQKKDIEDQKKRNETQQKDIEDQKKRNETQQKVIEDLQDKVRALEKSQRCSKCQNLLDNKKSFCSACVCKSLNSTKLTIENHIDSVLN